MKQELCGITERMNSAELASFFQARLSAINLGWLRKSYQQVSTTSSKAQIDEAYEAYVHEELEEIISWFQQKYSEIDCIKILYCGRKLSTQSMKNAIMSFIRKRCKKNDWDSLADNLELVDIFVK